MPIYEYRCDRGHTFEVMQGMTDAPVTSCTVCDASVQRVFHPVAVHFKGSGFYTTDYGKKEAASGASSDDSSKPADSKAKDGAKDGAKKKDSGGSSSTSTAGSGAD